MRKYENVKIDKLKPYPNNIGKYAETETETEKEKSETDKK